MPDEADLSTMCAGTILKLMAEAIAKLPDESRAVIRVPVSRLYEIADEDGVSFQTAMRRFGMDWRPC